MNILSDTQVKAIFDAMRCLDAVKWGMDYNTAERVACLETTRNLISAFPDIRFETSSNPAWAKIILAEIRDASVRKHK